ncbi:hypothetical protein CVT25_006220 [Psilocybe cyanescens]|uniref:BTB domain-containing protein n=1 Tax=Psilocybe cyanescens TaxID=93625 RepID=A0A409XKJ8_PSICY|nr:hypothetical protein CVT25_006220 [Psilocybe cyanescens]
MDGSCLTRPKSGTDTIIVRHPDFYFSDGSVVIIVEKTAFRIHQSVLARHSEVFKGMWDVPQPQKTDTYDGCPSVVLQDSVNDFVDVMRVLYDAFHFDKIRPDTSLSHLITFISGILRISTKYNMQQLRNKCITIIQDKFPSSLRRCDDVLTRSIQYVPSEIVRIIPLARETTIPKVLPWAFYLCAHISVDEILSNTVLSWKDKSLCLAGKEPNTGMHHRMPGARNGASATQVERYRINPHPLEEYTDWRSLMICIKCQAMVEAQHREGREKVWQKLPSLFHLGTWEDINKDQSC